METINKAIKIIAFILILLIALLIFIINSFKEEPQKAEKNNETQLAEVILDECTDEYEIMESKTTVTAAKEEKISPNCKLILSRYYKKCGDTTNEYLQVPDELVNMTKKDLQQQYKDWEIKEFTSGQVLLYKEFTGECGEHYILKDEDGKIEINKILENGEETLYEKTEIATDYLPEKDKQAIKAGLKVNGKEKLNELIESFE